MAELRLLIGLPASGKTITAKQLVERNNLVQNPERWERINWDEMRIARGLDIKKFNRLEEKEMQKASFGIAELHLRNGRNVVIDNTNLNPNTRAKWKGVAQRANVSYVEYPIETPLEVCISRDAQREGNACVGRAVIERMALFGDLIKFPYWEKYIVVDMDGSLADCSHRRQFLSDHNLDWASFEGPLVLEDEPRWPIINLVKMLNAGTGDGDTGYAVLIVSGRKIDRSGKNTVKWLEKYQVPFKYIFMRQGDDNRSDNIVKKEILDKLPKDQIEYVLDDRNQVVDMWRENGLTCLQVAPGDF